MVFPPSLPKKLPDIVHSELYVLKNHARILLDLVHSKIAEYNLARKEPGWDRPVAVAGFLLQNGLKEILLRS